MRDEKLHAVLAQRTFRSQNAQNTPGSEHFWKLRCPKSAHRCGAKHIFKSKCTRHTRFEALLEVAMSKKCTPLRREAHFQVKMCKTHQVRSTFGSWDVAVMILRDRCSTLYELASLFRGKRNTLNRWNRKIATRIGTRPSALFSTFHVWRKSCRIASFFDVVNLQIWGSLAG